MYTTHKFDLDEVTDAWERINTFCHSIGAWWHVLASQQDGITRKVHNVIWPWPGAIGILAKEE